MGIEKIDGGDTSAIPELWAAAGGDPSTIVSAVSDEMKSSIDDMTDIDKIKRLAKTMVKAHVKKKLDPNGDGRITEEEFGTKIVSLFNEDGRRQSTQTRATNPKI